MTAAGSGASNIDELVAYLRKSVLTVFFILDVSGSVKGERLDALNAAVSGVLPALRKKEAKEAEGLEIRAAVMEFSSAARWTFGPEPVTSFTWEGITSTGGGTNYGAAFRALNESLTRDACLSPGGQIYHPFILLIVDGKPSDPMLYGEDMARLESNPWFRGAARAGIAIGEGASSPECREALRDFAGGREKTAVFAVKNLRLLAGQVQIAVLGGVDSLLERGPAREAPAAETLPSFSAAPDRFTPDSGIDIDWQKEFLGPISPAGR